MPIISVIMGAFNASNRISPAIESIINQTYNDWELIICDDGSSDNTYEVISNFSKSDPRIIVLKNVKNSGLAYSLNRCIEQAKGSYIARMDDDDISHADRLEKQLDYIVGHSQYVVVGTSRNMYDKNGVWGTDIVQGERSNIDVYRGRNFYHPTVMIKTDVLKAVCGYSIDKKIGRTEDLDLWCKIYASGYKGCNISDVLFDYYEARDSYNRRKYKYRIAECRVKLMWRKKMGVSVKYLAFAFRPLLVGLLPPKLLAIHHERLYKKSITNCHIR